MNNSNLSKKNLISYITKNYIKFKLFLKKLEENAKLGENAENAEKLEK